MKTLLKFYFTIFSVFYFGQDYSSFTIPENLLQNANAVIREKTEDCVLKSVNDMTIKKTYAITILNKAGEEFSVVAIPYNPTTKVNSIKVELYDAAGKPEKTYGKKDFSDYTNNRDAALYVDDRVLLFQPIATKYPYTIKVSYETNTSNTIYLSSFRPFYSYNISLQKSDFIVTNNSGIKIRTRTNDTPLAKATRNEEGNTWKYSYENIAAIAHEDLSPSIDYLMPEVEFSPEKFTLAGKQGDFSDWNNFGKWYYNQLINPVSTITPEISAEVAALNLSGTTSEKIRTLYQYMQNKTRYILIAMGIGGWQPMPASEVSKKGYGDCKALTNYMRTLLTAAGIKSYYAVIYDDPSVIRFDKDFPKFSGNHVILMIPTENGKIWLENTSQKMAFNHLSYSSHNRNVLAVNESGIEIIDTPVYQPEESQEKMKAKIKLTEDGNFVSDANFEFTGGQYDKNLRLFSMQNDEIQETLKNRHRHLKIDGIAIQNLQNDKNNAKILYDITLKANGFSKKLGNDMFFPVMPYYQTMMLSGNDERKLPFETAFPFQDDYEIEFTIPEGYKFSEIPAPSEIITEFGTYSINFKTEDKKLLVHRVLTIKKGIYPKEKFKDYLGFRKKVAGNDNTKVLISKL